MLYTTAPLSIFNRIVAELNACVVVWCGCLPYSQALGLQMRICALKKRGYKRDVLLLLEHPPVITLGRSAERKNLLADENYLREKGIDLQETDRGGDFTFHGPGQLIGYPLMALGSGERDVRNYMRRLEESLIRLLRKFGIESFRDSGYTGVWTKSGKIAAMGVHISRWITRHGFALNVNTDLSFFDLIVPCGISNRSVTSVQELLARKLDLQSVAEKYIQEFEGIFKRHMIKMDFNGLRSELDRFEEMNDPVQGSPF
ncbi:MAG: lipoyl(octanoyl) transferase LipB [Acidobacteria bacterium]|nr:lipoyl(octanoyl) transferase LipB [Acidobacteriota bacterium]